MSRLVEETREIMASEAERERRERVVRRVAETVDMLDGMAALALVSGQTVTVELYRRRAEAVREALEAFS